MSEARQRSPIIVAYIIVFIAFIDNFSMFPTVGPYTRHLGGDALAMGVVVGAYSATNLILNIVGGIMLDRSGRRRLLLLGLAMAAASMAMYGFADSLSSLLVVRLIHGAAGGILVPAVFTMIADLAPAKSRGQAMGRAGALIGATAVLCPAMAGIVRQAAGFSAVFYTAAAFLAVGLVLAYFRLPETALPAPAAGPQGPSKPPADSSARPLPSDPPTHLGRQVTAAYWGIFSLTFATGILTAFLPDLVESMGYRPGITGLMFTCFGLVAALVMMSPLSQIVDRRGLLTPTSAGLVLLGTSMAILTGASSLLSVAIASAVFGVGHGLIFPATSGQLANAAGSERRGIAYGLYYAAFSLGVVAGAPLGGWFVSRVPGVASPFFPGVVMSFLGLAIVYSLARTALTRGTEADDGSSMPS